MSENVHRRLSDRRADHRAPPSFWPIRSFSPARSAASIVALAVIAHTALAQTQSSRPGADRAGAEVVRSLAGRVVIGTGTLARNRLQIYVQSSDGGWLVYNRERRLSVTAGDSVEITGVISAYRGMPELSKAQVRVVPGPPRLIAAVPVTFRTVAAHLGELVELSAVVSRAWTQSGDPSLELKEGDHASSVTSEAALDSSATIRLYEYADGVVPVDLRPFNVGDRLAVTGVLARRDDVPGVPIYILLPRVPSDVRSLSWTTGRKETIAVVGLAVLLVVGTGVAWIFLLRREIRRRTRALEASESRYARIFAESPAGNFVSTPDGRLLACNERFASLLGFASTDDACRASTKALYANETTRVATLEKLTREGRLTGLDLELQRADGSTIYVQENVVGQFNTHHELVELHGFLLDVSERRRLETEFRQAQKMESIGRLAGGVAHDFNNLLTVIVAASDLALECLGPEHGAREDLVEIRHAAQRGVELTKQLLAFSRRQVLTPAVNDVAGIVGGLASLLRRLVGETVTITFVLPEPARCAVLVDASVFEQAIINLAVNAADAMPNGGALRIEVSEVLFDAAFVATHEGAREGHHCCIRVCDTGMGMDEATMLRAFEPFFTTKPVGKGTGLGLSMVFGFVKQSGGYVLLDSLPGAGTTVALYLPRCTHEGPVATASLAANSDASGDRRAAGRGTALVVEDEPQVRAIASRILRGLGFDVIDAADPVQALALSHTVASLSVVLTDVVMPNGGGAEVARRIRAIFPGVPLVYMSGYTDDDVVVNGVSASTHDFLAKPFTPSSLTAKVLSVVQPVASARATEPHAAAVP